MSIIRSQLIQTNWLSHSRNLPSTFYTMLVKLCMFFDAIPDKHVGLLDTQRLHNIFSARQFK